MTNTSKSTQISSLEPPSALVRKFADSNIVGFNEQLAPCSSSHLPSHPNSLQDATKTINCNFRIKIPTNALRIDMSILFSTGSNGCKSHCKEAPSVAYKITICTPQCRQKETNGDNDFPSTTTTFTTLKWSSKLTIARGMEDQNPYHEWSGIFDLGNKKDINLCECSFHQVEGVFQSNYDDCNLSTVPTSPISLCEQELQKIKRKRDGGNDVLFVHTEKKAKTSVSEPE